MSDRVAIIGIGFTSLQPSTPHASFKELMFEAAQKAYHDAGVEPSEIDSFVTCAEDLNEGLSIFDEYTPDQLGLKRRFAFVFLRWIGMLFIAFTPIPYALGRYRAFELVIVYVALTIYAEFRPDRFLAAFGETDKR